VSAVRITPGIIGPVERVEIPPDAFVLPVPQGCGHVRAVRNGGEVAVLVFEGGKTQITTAVPAAEAKGRVLWRGPVGWVDCMVA